MGSINIRNIRLGLCCIFKEQPIKFRQTTAKILRTLSRGDQLVRLSDICLHNLNSLKESIDFVIANNIGAFRILSPLLPRYTHPEVGYSLEDLPERDEIFALFHEVQQTTASYGIRLSFHPDQFNVLASPKPQVIANTFRELEYHGMLAEMLGVDVVNLHVGGAYGDKSAALSRLKKNVKLLPQTVLKRLTFENDDVSYTPADLLPVCEELGIPMVYDVHHHRCLADGLSEERVTTRVIELWEKRGLEPYFHISSPKNGWQNGSSKPHADYIDPNDFPECWKGLCATVDVEAKAKELAVLRLQKELKISVIDCI